MDCQRARQLLWPPERLRIVGDDLQAAREHLATCECCVSYFRQDRRLLDAYDRAKDVEAPKALRGEIEAALRQPGGVQQESASRFRIDAPQEVDRIQSPLPVHRRREWVALIVAIAVVVAGITIVRAPAPTSYAPGDVFVEDYLRRAVGEDHIVTNDPAQVTRFLERELGFRIRPIQLAGLSLERAEICLLEGRRGAMIVYKKGDLEISHYVVPREGSTSRLPAISPHRPGTAPVMPVVTWASPSVEQALVGEIDSDELLEIARRGSAEGP